MNRLVLLVDCTCRVCASQGGHWCPAGSTAAKQRECAAGRYGVVGNTTHGGSVDDMCTGPCKVSTVACVGVCVVVSVCLCVHRPATQA